MQNFNQSKKNVISIILWFLGALVVVSPFVELSRLMTSPSGIRIDELGLDLASIYHFKYFLGLLVLGFFTLYRMHLWSGRERNQASEAIILFYNVSFLGILLVFICLLVKWGE